MYVYKDWHWYKISVHSNCLEHAIECSSVQWNARACHRMRFFYQNVFSSYSFIVNDVWPARMHSIACSRMRLHSRAFHCMLENSNACSSHVLYTFIQIRIIVRYLYTSIRSQWTILDSAHLLTHIVMIEQLNKNTHFKIKNVLASPQKYARTLSMYYYWLRQNTKNREDQSSQRPIHY